VDVSESTPVWIFVVIGIVVGLCVLFATIFIVFKLRTSNKSNATQQKEVEIKDEQDDEAEGMKNKLAKATELIVR
jgi:uncharacterized membrane-anchored protein YhcB (DUF1043 family)